jgi:hypothetical protein
MKYMLLIQRGDTALRSRDDFSSGGWRSSKADRHDL